MGKVELITESWKEKKISVKMFKNEREVWITYLSNKGCNHTPSAGKYRADWEGSVAGWGGINLRSVDKKGMKVGSDAEL